MIDPSWDWSEVAAAWPLVRTGFAVTAFMTLLVMAVGVPLGLAISTLTASRLPIVRPAEWILVPLCGLFRVLPTLVILAMFAVLVPGASSWLAGAFAAVGEQDAESWFTPIRLAIGEPPFAAAVMTLSLVLAARVEAAVRHSARIIDPQLIEVATAMGMSRSMRLTRVIFPETARTARVAIARQWVRAFRDSTLAAFIGCSEVLGTVLRGTEETPSMALELFTLMALCFLVIIVPAELIMNRFDPARRGEHTP